MRHSKPVSLCLFVLASLFAFPANKSISEIAKHAIDQSQLTLPGSRPFHMKVKIVEATNPDNLGYNAEIEEYWAAPDKWRRTITAREFSQTLVVNGDKTSEKLTGDYYPLWLRSMVVAVFEPATLVKALDETLPSDNPVFGGGDICRRYTMRAGVPPVGNNVFSTYCFTGDHGLLKTVMIPGYHAGYKDYKKFADKQVARQIREYIQPGEELEASITELSELNTIDEKMFGVTNSAPPLQSIAISEAGFRRLIKGAPEVVWPPIRGGKPKGVLSIYVSLDRSGHIRETYGLNSDNPDMADAAMKQVREWVFSPAAVKGERVQVESLLTFAYETKIEDPYPVLNDQESRQQANKLTEPKLAGVLPPGTSIKVRVSVGEDGLVKGTLNTYNASGRAFLNVAAVTKEWKFKPLLRDGKATAFNADITFTAR